MKAEQPIFLIHNKIKWHVFKSIYDKLPRDDGPAPVGMDKVLWDMVRKRMIYVYLDDTHPDDPMIISLKLPEGRPVKLITNPDKKKT